MDSSEGGVGSEGVSGGGSDGADGRDDVLWDLGISFGIVYDSVPCPTGPVLGALVISAEVIMLGYRVGFLKPKPGDISCLPGEWSPLAEELFRRPLAHEARTDRGFWLLTCLSAVYAT
jgi:hypothetical protein